MEMPAIMPRSICAATLFAVLPLCAAATPPAYCGVSKKSIASACRTLDSFVRVGLTDGYESTLEYYQISLRTEDKDLIIDYGKQTHRTPYQGEAHCNETLQELTIMSPTCPPETQAPPGLTIIQSGDKIIILHNSAKP